MKTNVFCKHFKLFCLIAAGIAFNTCDTPIGLGGTIDIAAPVVSINTEYSAAPGSYISGSQKLFINATDDSGISYVSVNYYYNVDDGTGRLTEQGPVSANAVWDGEKGCYVFDFDTAGMADGAFKVIITAVDTSGKSTTTPELIYTVKNKPPFISLQIPRPVISGSALASDILPGVVTDNYMMGVFEDLAGVASGYPWIKFWKEGDIEPGTNGSDFTANAGWKGVTSKERDMGSGWIRADEGFVENMKGERGGSFRFYLRKRTSTGEEYPIGEGEHLEVGRYNVKILAADILGSVLEWPRGAFSNEPGFITIELLASGTPPEIKYSLDPDQQSHREEFKISAWATPHGELDADIAELFITVNNGVDKSGNKSDVVLVCWQGEGQIAKDVWKQIEVNPSLIYYEDKTTGSLNFVNDESNLQHGVSYVKFLDGNYSFTITAVGTGGSRENVSFSLYIDSVPPRTEITSVNPFVRQKTSGGIREWTVNSTVVIEVNSTDNRGSAIDTENNFMKFKYLLLKENEDTVDSDFSAWDKPGSVADYLYQRKDAKFFDDKSVNDSIQSGNANPVIKIDGLGGDYRLVLQTHKYSAEAQYKLFIYIMSEDSAGNASYQKACLNVDQETDKPDVKLSHSSFLNENSFVTINVSDDDGLTADSVFYRYAKNENDKKAAKWMPLPVTIQGDGKTAVINDLSMLKIACDLLGIAFNPSAAMNDDHRNALGGETETKFLQVRAFDNKASPPKVYDTDGEVWGDSGIWREFKIDLTPPKIIASEKDEKGNLISERDDDKDSFVIPQKDGSYRVFDFAYGDIIENNLLSITVKVNGNDRYTKTYMAPDVIPTLSFGENEPVIDSKNDFAVWKPFGTADGHIRWRVPMKWVFDKLEDGSHTFEIIFHDRVPQITSRLITFYRDKDGPEIDLIVPCEKIYINDINNISAVQQTALTNSTIMDTQAKLIGFFNDSFSSVFNVSGNNGYYFKISGNGYNSGWKFVNIPSANITESKSVSWHIDLDGSMLPNLSGGNLPDGTYLLSMRIKDSHGNGYGQSDDAAVEEAIAKSGKNGGPGFEKNLAFRLDRSVPALTVSQVSAFQSKDVTITGTITETGGVRRLSVRHGANEIAAIGSDDDIKNNPKIPAGGSISLKEEGEKSFSFSVTIPSVFFNETSYSLMINATGASGQSAMDVRTFTYDRTPPPVNFTVPSAGNVIESGVWRGGSFKVIESGRWVTGSPRISGTADDSNGVKNIHYHLGRLDETGGNRDKVYDDPANWYDTGLHTNNASGDWDGGLYFWTFQRSLNGWLNNTAEIYKNDPNDDKFRIPLYVKVEDQAGNISVIQYRIWVDPEADMPTTAITFPEPNMSVGGEVRISGTAYDNNMVQAVEIRITPAVQTGDDSALVAILQNGYYKDTSDEWAYPNPVNSNITSTKDDEIGWIKANIQGNNDTTVPWFYISNKDGLLSPVTAQSRNVMFEVRSVDTKDMVNKIPDLKGGAASLSVKFNAGVPMIDTPKIIKTGFNTLDYADGIRVSGEFKITTTVKDEGGISSIKARASGGSGFVEIVANGRPVGGNGGSLGGSSGVAWRITRYPNDKDLQASDNGEGLENGRFFEYDLEFTVDTINNPVLTYGKTGNFTLDLQVYDNNKSPAAYNTNGTYTMGVDNFYPLTSITTQYNAATSNFYVSGKAWDYGSGSGGLQGLERVLVYFSRGSKYFNAKFKEITNEMTNKANVRDTCADNFNASDQTPNAPVFARFPVITLHNDGVWRSDHAMVIDRQEISADRDGDGTIEIWERKGSDTEWQALLDTKKFSDGPLTVHYIVMDQAGNATHYKEDIYIGNKKPFIRFINLGTDIDLSGAVEKNEYVPTTWTVSDYVNGEMSTVITNAINTDFRARNKSFAVKLTALYGNNWKNYRVSYVNEDENKIVEPHEVKTGNVYTIVGGDFDTDWRRYGSPNNMEGTVFVASVPINPPVSAKPGRVVEYVCTAEKAGRFDGHSEQGGGNSQVITFSGSVFGNGKDQIPDTSDKKIDEHGNMITQNGRLFIIKIYDETVPPDFSNPLDETKQLAHAAFIRVDIDNEDETAAKINFAPFGKKYVLDPSKNGAVWSNNADKILRDAYESEYNENIVNGYIQYAKHSSSGNADISGKVIFRGKAMDNQRIQRITAEIAGFNNGQEFTIGEWLNGEIKPVSGHSKNDVNADWYFEAQEQHLSLEYGHALNWAFAWDSSTVSGIVAKDVNVTFKAYDFASNAAADNSGRETTTVNIVPYISEIVTPLSAAYSVNPSAFNRSALGWYPVREDDTIEIKGFNFNGASTNVTVGGASLDGVAAVGNNERTHISARVDNNAAANDANTIVSGPLVVTVNGIESINNSNHKTARYNQEPNGLNNNTLNDDRYLYVWNTGFLLNERVLHSPFMRMDAGANRYISYGVYTANTGRFRITKNNSNPNADVETYNNRYRNTTVAFDSAGDWYGAASNMTAFDQSAFTFFARATAGGSNGVAGTNKRIIMRILNNGIADIDRVKIPRIFVQHTREANNQGVIQQGNNDNADRIFMSYYDGNNSAQYNPVFFKYGTIGANNYFGGNLANQNAASAPAAVQTVADDRQTHKGGVYTAVGALSNGLPVIAWYDRTNQNLVFSYGSGTPSSNVYNNANAIVTTSTAEWQANAVVVQSFAGTHVDMAVDAGDNVHLAYYDVRNGGLYYAYISVKGTGKDAVPDTGAIKTARVDTYLSAGTKLMINIRREGSRYVPYISYFHASFAETRNSIRVAWLLGEIADGTKQDDSFTGAWEVMTVPSGAVPLSDEFVTHGVPSSSSTSWAPTAGTLRGRDISRSILVGYMTTDWYEGAVLKHEIWK